MTGLTPPSCPTRSPTSVSSDTTGNCRKTAGFYPDFPKLVPAIPATKSCDQGGNFGKCSIYRGDFAEISAESLVPLILFGKRGHSFKE
ncbi:unnamed protein product [Prunus armeniaca]